MGVDTSRKQAHGMANWWRGNSWFAVLANHGGGYSWRLCKKGGNVTEECFQENTLPFHGKHSWLRYVDSIPSRDGSGPMKIPDLEIPRVVVPGDQVNPKGSHWARNPIPGCNYCDQAKCGNMLPNMTEQVTGLEEEYDEIQYGGNAWYKQELCAQQCTGLTYRVSSWHAAV